VLGAPRPRSPLRSASGFTLIETLVAMVAGLIIALAAFELLTVTDHETERATNYLSSSQLGGATMTHITGELASACFKYELSPLLEKSTGELLVFEDAQSKEAEIPLEQIQKHEIEWKETGTVLVGGTKRPYGNLFDTRYTASGESGSSYTWKEPGTKVRIGERIMRETVTEGGVTKEQPFFSFYKYAPEAEDKYSTEATIGEAGESSLKKMTATEVAKEPGEVVSVAVGFRALATDGKATAEQGQSLAQHSQVAFSFSAPVAEPTISEGGPCQ
jgi:prepilin-type N-terminal cleavage/methylation domain-containing protein